MQMQKVAAGLVTLGDIRIAIALLTRVPVKAEFERSARAVWAYPIAGLLVGLIASIAVTVAFWLGLSVPLAAGIWIATTVLVTGAMHEDGLADCADGFWGGFERARRLEIMRDSQIGTYGVLALVLSVGLRWLATAAILASGSWMIPLILCEILSRAAMPAVMNVLPHARGDGLSQSQGQPERPAVLLAFGIAYSLALLCLGWVALKLAILAALATFGMIMLAKRKIAGQTGDVLGATQQIVLIITLAALS